MKESPYELIDSINLNHTFIVAAFISSKLLYFPVPTISRDANTRPATSKVSLSA